MTSKWPLLSLIAKSLADRKFANWGSCYSPQASSSTFAEFLLCWVSIADPSEVSTPVGLAPHPLAAQSLSHPPGEHWWALRDQGQWGWCWFSCAQGTVCGLTRAVWQLTPAPLGFIHWYQPQASAFVNVVWGGRPHLWEGWAPSGPGTQWRVWPCFPSRERGPATLSTPCLDFLSFFHSCFQSVCPHRALGWQWLSVTYLCIPGFIPEWHLIDVLQDVMLNDHSSLRKPKTPNCKPDKQAFHFNPLLSKESLSPLYRSAG